MNYIGFPGLGIGPFAVDPTAFTLFGHKVAWYGVIIACGMLIAFIISHHNMTKKEGLKTDDFLDTAIFTVPTAVVFARIFYVIFSPNEFGSFLDMIAIWNGGISILGCIIGGVIAITCVALFKKTDPLKLLDAVAPSVLVGQVIGRWGNFMNAEVYGKATTLPWRMSITNAYGTVEVHPLFLYEGILNLIGLIVILLMYRNKKFDGQIVFSYIFWYGLVRSSLELLRDDTYILTGPGGLPASFIVSLVGCIAGAALLIVFGIRAKKKREAEK